MKSPAKVGKDFVALLVAVTLVFGMTPPAAYARDDRGTGAQASAEVARAPGAGEPGSTNSPDIPEGESPHGDRRAHEPEASSAADVEAAPDVDGPEGPKAYAYRLLVGFDGAPDVREADEVIGSYGNAVLIGFETPGDLEEAQRYYREHAAFATIDGALDVAAGSGGEADADTVASAESTVEVGADDNPLTLLATELELSDLARDEARPESEARRVALVDTGVGEDCEVSSRASVLGDAGIDGNGHGTEMLVTMRAENPDAEVVSIRALGDDGRGSVASVYAGIEYAVEVGADIVNLSFSTRATAGNAAVAAAIEDALASGAEVVAAAGNASDDASLYAPGNIEGVYTVGALDGEGNPLPESNYGPRVDVFVEGTSTSYAAARVSGWLSANLADGWRQVIGDALAFRGAGTGDGPGQGAGEGAGDSPSAGADEGPSAGADEGAGDGSEGTPGSDSEGDPSGEPNDAENGRDGQTPAEEAGVSGSPEGSEPAAADDASPDAGRSGDDALPEEPGLLAEIGRDVSKGKAVSELAEDLDEYVRETGGRRYAYTVSFDANGGVGQMDDWHAEFAVGELAQMELPANRFTRDGYRFDGWYPVIPEDSGLRAGLLRVPDAQSLTNMDYLDEDGSIVTLGSYADVEGRIRFEAGWVSDATGALDAGDAYSNDDDFQIAQSWGDYSTLYKHAAVDYVNTKGVAGTYYWLSTSKDAVKVKNVSYGKGVPFAKVPGKSSTPVYAWNYEDKAWTSVPTTDAGYVDFRDQVSLFTTVGPDGEPSGVEAYWFYTVARTGVSCLGKQFYSDDAQGVPIYRSVDQTFFGHDYNLTNKKAGSDQEGVKFFGAKPYYIAFNGNGGTGSMDDQLMYAGAKAARIALSGNTYKRVGYTFSGWNTKKDGSGTKFANREKVANGFTGKAADIVSERAYPLYAQWDPVSFNVAFEPNGGTGSMGNQTLTYDTSAKLSACRYRRSGFQFAGWNTKADGSGKAYADEQTVKNLTAKGGETVTLYAQWSSNPYTVSFDANGGTGSMGDIVMSVGVARSLPKCGFTAPSGMVFDGWNTKANGSGTAYADCDSVVDLTTVANGRVTLYAQWSADASYRIDYYLHGGSGSFPRQKKQAGQAIRLYPQQPTPPADSHAAYTVTFDANGGACATESLSAAHVGGYAFAGWNDDESGTGNAYLPGAAYTADADLRLHALWEPLGTTDTIALPDAWREGYDFLGWASEGSATSGMTGAYTPTGDVTLHAIWSSGAARETYTVRYDANGGSTAPSSQMKVADEPLTLSALRPVAPISVTRSATVSYDARGGRCERESDVARRVTSSMFTGWNTAQDGSGTDYAPGATYRANAPATLYAQWRQATTSESIELPTPVKDGCIFAGWSSDAGAGTGLVGTFTPTENVTLHALWVTLDENEVSYNANGGDNAPAPQTKVQGRTLRLSGNVPSHPDDRDEFLVGFDPNGGECPTAFERAERVKRYTFQGWNTREDGSGTTYAPGAAYDVDEAVVLYAQWATVDEAGAVTLPVPTRPGYTFAGWAATKTAAKGITGTYAPTGDITLRAVWKGMLNGALDIVKKGSPISDVNADDLFPLTIELQNTHGYSLDDVVASDSDFLAAPAADPRMSASKNAVTLGNIIEGVQDATNVVMPADDGLPLNHAPRDAARPLIALIDTGAPDCENVVGRYSVIGDVVDDDNGHGSAMLEAILAENPAAQVVSIKALDEDGRGTGAGVYAAIELAVSKGATIVNLSLSARDTVANSVIAKGVEDAYAAGCAVIASAGNGGYDAKYFVPANLSAAFTVSAADPYGNVLAGANRGRYVDAFVEARSTSEACAKVSGWLSAHEVDAWREAVRESELSVDVGNGDIDFVGENDGLLLDQVTDSVIAAATYTMTVSFHANGATQTETPYFYKDYYHKLNGSICVWSPTKNGTYTNETSEVRTDETSATLKNMVGRASLVKTGYHVLDDNDGYTTYYNLNAAGTGTNINADGTTTKKLNGGTQITSNVKKTIYVNWKLNKYTVAYNANGGTGAPANQTKTHGTNLTLSSTKPSKANASAGSYTVALNANGGSCSSTSLTAPRTTKYSFTNWSASTGGTWNAGASFTGNASEHKATITMTANYSSSTATSAVNLPTATRSSATQTGSTVSFNAQGGTAVASKTATDTVSYAFGGWATSSTATSGFTGSYTPTGNTTLYAAWTPSVTKGSLTLPSSSRSGYTFLGWSKSPTATSPSYYAGDTYTPAANETLYAVWQESGRLVYYNGNGGSFAPSTSPVSVTPGHSTTLPQASGGPAGDQQNTGNYRTVSYNGNGGSVGGVSTSNARSYEYNNYVFAGWYSAATGGAWVGGAFGSYTPQVPSQTLYMHWTNNPSWRALALAPAQVITSAKPSVALGACTVSFDARGGTSTGAPGDAISAPRTRSYAFGGWNTSPDGTGANYAAGETYTPAGDVTLYARWDGVDSTSPITLPAPVRAGYDFKGWATSPDATSGMAAGTAYTPTGALTLYATWEEASYTVSFDANGGTGSMERQVAYGAHDFTIPEVGFVKAGYHALWNTEPDGTGTTYLPNTVARLAHDTTLYAIWTSNTVRVMTVYLKAGETVTLSNIPEHTSYTVVDGAQPARWSLLSKSPQTGTITGSEKPSVTSESVYDQCVVTFDANGGSGSMRSSAVLADDEYTVPECLFEKAGARFSSWNTSADGSGLSYEPHDRMKVSASTTLYAQWAYPLAVAYDANGGAGAMEAVSVFKGDAHVVSQNGFSREGCYFTGWNTRADGTGASYAPGEALTVTAPVTLFAQWITGSSGEAYAVLLEGGELVLFRSRETYAAGPGQTVRDLFGNEYTGRVYTGIEAAGKPDESNSPWRDQAGDIVSARVAPRQTVVPLNMAYWFNGCEHMASFDTAGLDTARLTDITRVFNGCSSLAGVDVGGWDTSHVTALSGAFSGCASLKEAAVGDWNVSLAHDFSYVFDGCSSLASLDLTGWDLGRATTISHMFNGCANLASISGIGLLDVSNVVDMDSAFSGCARIPVLDVGAWDTSKVECLHATFSGCASLASLDLNGWRTSLVEDMSALFEGTGALMAVGISTWDTARVTNMSSMFAGVGAASLDLLGFNVSKVTDASRMFYGCQNLVELDQMSFDTRSLADAHEMFAACPQLTTIYATESWVRSGIVADRDMFAGSEKLVGGNGTAYDRDIVDKRYALIDKFGQKGYFTNALEPAHLTFDANGGSGTMDELAAPRGDYIEVPACAFTPPAGYLFAGWNTAPDLTGDIYPVGSQYHAVSDVVLYAHWVYPEEVRAYATLDSDGSLVIFNAIGVHEAGPAVTLTDIDGNVHEGRLYVGIADTGDAPPWRGEASLIREASVQSGQVVAVNTVKEWFAGCENLARASLEGLDTSAVSDMSGLFEGCTSLEVAVTSGLDTSSVHDMSRMFADCPRLKALGVKGFDTGVVETFAEMFVGCASVAELDLASFDTSSATSMTDMFARMTALSLVELGPAFSFTGGGATYCELPEPPIDECHTGEWTAGAGDYTPAELSASFDGPTMAGTYRWTVRVPSAHVLFKANGGEGYMEDAPVYAGEAFVVPESRFWLVGSQFTRWNTDPHGLGQDYYPGQAVSVPVDMTLYAQWSGTSDYPSDEGAFGLAIENEALGGGSTTGVYQVEFETDGKPAAGSFPYATTDGRLGFVSSGGHLSVPSGQTAIVYGLPAGMGYHVGQVSAGGWHLASSSGECGFIGAGVRGYVVEDFCRWLEGYSDAASGFEPYFTHQVRRLLTGPYHDGALPHGRALDQAVLKSLLEEGSAADMVESLCYTVPRGSGVASLGAAVSGLASHEVLARALEAASYADIASGADVADGSFMGIVFPQQLQVASFTNEEDSSDAAYAILSGSELIFFRSTGGYTSGDVVGAVDVEGNTYSGRLYSGVEDTGDTAPWADRARSIATVRFVGEQYIHPKNCKGWFDGCSQLTSVEKLGNLRTETCADMSYMFRDCAGLASLDLAMLETLNVRDLSHMFEGCTRLSALDLGGFETLHVDDMSSLFSKCRSMTRLDISGFDTGSVARMGDMFAGMEQLSEIVLGPEFSFKGAGITAQGDQALLPTPPDAYPNTGKWARTLNGSFGAGYTASELRDSYAGTSMAGVYAWETKPYCTISYASNGGTGYMTPTDAVAGAPFKVSACGFTRVGYEFAGWNSEADGSGESSAAGSTMTVRDDTVLFAQWRPIQLVFSVPTSIDFVAKADGTLIGPSDDVLKIESSTPAGIVIDGVRTEAGEGFSFADDPTASGEYDYWFDVGDSGTERASHVEGDAFTSEDWRIKARSHVSLFGLGGKIAAIDEALLGTKASLGSVTWRLTIGRARIEYEPNGASATPVVQETSSEVGYVVPGCRYEPPAGKTFAGWNTQPDGSGRTYETGSTAEFADDTKLYAMWL